MSEEPHTVAVLRRVATHVLARARFQATGKISLRVTPGGFGTPAMGPEARRVRIAGAFLVCELEGDDVVGTRCRPILGSTLRQLADLAGVDLGADFTVGPDGMPLGDPEEPIVVDLLEVRRVSAWYELVAEVLDGLLTTLPPEASTGTVPRLWPEHFDLAVEAGLRDGGDRVNLGGSPGDASTAEPYVYVGPWSPARPGDPGFWNAPFGAVRTRGRLGPDPASTAAAFLREGYDRLAAERLPSGGNREQ